MSLVTYYMPWDDSGSGIQIPELSEDNYRQWSCHVQQALQLHPDKLWDVVSSDDEPTKANLLRRQRAEALIMLAIGNKFKSYRYSEYEGNPKKLWGAIKEDARRRHTPYSIRLRLSTTFLDKFPSVMDYTLKIDTLVQLLEFTKSRDAEWRMPKDEHTFWYLHGLPESWNEYVQEMMVGNIMSDESDPRNIMFNHQQLRKVLRAYEIRLCEGRNRQRTCLKCKQKGHIQRDCPELC